MNYQKRCFTERTENWKNHSISQRARTSLKTIVGSVPAHTSRPERRSVQRH
jgi:hypothetical protein